MRVKNLPPESGFWGVVRGGLETEPETYGLGDIRAYLPAGDYRRIGLDELAAIGRPSMN